MTAPAARCLNCEAAIDGPFCSRCGQRVQDPDPSLREMLSEAWEAFASVDGKFFASLRLLLLRPGVLTAEYLRGQRIRHLTPLRLYLLCSLAYFLVSSAVPERAEPTSKVSLSRGDTVVISGDDDEPRGVRGADSAATKLQRDARRDSTRRALLVRHGFAVAPGALDSAAKSVADSIRAAKGLEGMTAMPGWMRTRVTRGLRHLMSDGKTFGSDYKKQLPRLLFVLMPGFALLLSLVYRSRRRRYPVHLIVALHLHAFVFAVLALDELRTAVPWQPARAALKLATTLWLVGYVPLALRRVYGGRLRYALARSAVLTAGYTFIGAVAFAILAFALLLVY